MKNMIWTIVKRFFRKEINQMMEINSDYEKRQYYRQMQQEEETKRTIVNYPVGTKIISQSNEPNELLVAHVVRHEILHHGIMLIVKNSAGAELALLDKTPSLWAQEREDALQKLSWDERYNVMSKYHYFIDRETRIHKESDEYKNRLTNKTQA
jgi:uncharacterized damage-inducible protein DinB